MFRREGTEWTEEAKLIPGDVEVSSSFGKSVFIHDGYVVVGDSGNYYLGYQTGAAYVFRHEGTEWTRQAKLHRCKVKDT
ncbi:FG-GAP repeat protein [Desulfonema magnum]|uniref:FG-GAP repeat protein n=1 Tax=Desulfonema magnum TaxID=45655 RepID=UPI00338E68F4